MYGNCYILNILIRVKATAAATAAAKTNAVTGKAIVDKNHRGGQSDHDSNKQCKKHKEEHLWKEYPTYRKTQQEKQY